MSTYAVKKHRGQWRWNTILTVLIVYVGLTSYFDVLSNSVSVLLPAAELGQSSSLARDILPNGRATAHVRDECVYILRVDGDDACRDGTPEGIVDEWVLKNSPFGYGNVSERITGRRAHGMSVHTLLHEQRVIQDPSYGKNELLDSWVREDVWTLSTQFEWPYAARGAVLELDRVDSIADVYLDGRLIGRTSSMHRRYSLVVSLGVGKHNLSVTLFPVGKYSEEVEKTLPYPIPHTQHHVRVGHYNLVRKIAADFGWDFAPAFAPSGLLGSIAVSTARGQAVLEQVVVEQEHIGEDVVLHSFAFIKGVALKGEIQVDVRDPAGNVVGSSVTQAPTCQSHCTDSVVDVREEDEVYGDCFFKCQGPSITVKDPELWWTWDQSPSERKEQPLYSVTAVLACGSDCASTKTVMVGLRSFELAREPVSEGEESFFFRINGRMVYSKGSNLVPLEVFQDKIRADQIVNLVWSAKQAHFNTIRVWGGGGYLPDVFYEECDKHGILVWQEFMFACAAYPTDVRFQVDVASEVHQQSLRIVNHPSVALFGFNNENENSFDWFDQTVMNNALYSVDYYALFITVVRQTLRRVAPHVVYVDTSPSNGIYKEDPVYAKRWGDVMDERFGDVHFYEYGANLLSSDVFPKAKFISEFGILSLPSWNVYSKFVDETEDLRDMLEYRTRRKNGLQELFHQMQYHFFPHSQVPDLLNTIRKDTIRQYIYLSQLQQGLVYRNAALHWRRDMKPKQTMGFLYWQFQDVGHWAGPSWSGINSDASWKLLHYFSRQFFAPLAIFVDSRKGQAVHVYVSNHHHYSIKATMTVDIIPYSATKESEITRQCDVLVETFGYHKTCSFNMKNKTEGFIVASITSEQRVYQHSTVYLTSEAGEATLKPTKIIIESISLSDGDNECPPKYDRMFSMQVSCAPYPAVYVSFESEHDIHFTENGVHLLPWTSRTIQGCHHSSDRLSEEQLKNSIHVLDLHSALKKPNIVSS